MGLEPDSWAVDNIHERSSLSLWAREETAF